MIDKTPTDPEPELSLEYALDAPPEKVWRAISIAEYRERWLPATDLAEPEPLSADQGSEIRYRMRDTAPPFLESIVTFQLRPGPSGGTILRIAQHLASLSATQAPANDNRACTMLAA